MDKAGGRSFPHCLISAGQPRPSVSKCSSSTGVGTCHLKRFRGGCGVAPSRRGCQGKASDGVCRDRKHGMSGGWAEEGGE